MLKLQSRAVIIYNAVLNVQRPPVIYYNTMLKLQGGAVIICNAILNVQRQVVIIYNRFEGLKFAMPKISIPIKRY